MLRMVRKNNSGEWRAISQTLIILFISALLTACGGGTSGTGGDGATRILGTLVDQNGRPIISTRVQISETGDFGVTDSSGNFEFESALPSAQVTFEVHTQASNASATLPIPDQPLQINVSLRLNQQASELSIDSSEVRPRPTPAPRPTAEAEITDTIWFGWGISYPGRFLARARVRNREIDEEPVKMYNYPNTDYWSVYVRVPRRGGVVELKAGSTVFTVRVGKSKRGVGTVYAYTRLFPAPGAGTVAPSSIYLETSSVYPDGQELPTLELSPAYQGVPPPASSTPPPVSGTPPPPPGSSVDPTPTPYGGLEFSNLRMNLEFIATTGSLEGGVVRFAGSRLYSQRLYHYNDYNGILSYFVNLPLPTSEPAVAYLDLPSGKRFTVEFRNLPYEASYFNAAFDVFPRVTVGDPLPEDAGLSLIRIDTIPARFRDPSIVGFPAPPAGRGPTPTPVPTPPSTVYYNFNITSRYLNLDDATITLRDSGETPRNLTGYSSYYWYTYYALPPASTRIFDIETSAGPYVLSFRNVPQTANNVSASVEILAPNRRGNRFMELNYAGSYPEEGSLEVSASPSPP